MLKNPFFRDFDHIEVVNQLALKGVTVVEDFLTEYLTSELLSELGGMSLTKQPEHYGKRQVHQNFSSIGHFGTKSLFTATKDILEYALNQKFFLSKTKVISEELKLNEMSVQRYGISDCGIGIHKDGASIINLIVILMLEGDGDFYVCKDRDGGKKFKVPNKPRDMLLMRAPGFLGENIEPLHMVGEVRAQRTIFAMRHRKKKAA